MPWTKGLEGNSNMHWDKGWHCSPYTNVISIDTTLFWSILRVVFLIVLKLGAAKWLVLVNEMGAKETSAIPLLVLLIVGGSTRLKQFGMLSQCIKDCLGQSLKFTEDFAGVDISTLGCDEHLLL